MSLGAWYPTFRVSVIFFERRHPMTCRHMQLDGNFICTATNAHKFGFFYLFEQYKKMNFYFFIFFFDMAVLSLGNGASNMATVHPSRDR
jgi:hypothetical protein